MSHFDTLVLSGGGVYGYSILGCIAYMFENGMLDHVTTYIGTSIGAIIGYLLAIGCTPLEIVLNFNRTKVLQNLGQFDLVAMANGHGACHWDTVQKFLEEVTISKIGEFVNLRDLQEKYNRKLICTTYNLDKQIIEYVGPDTNPSIPALVALRMSSNVPLIFPLFKYQNSHYIDGGILDNLPIEYALQCLNIELTPEGAEAARQRILTITMDYTAANPPQKDYNVIEMMYRVLMAPMNLQNRTKTSICTQYSTLYRLKPHEGVKFYNFNIKTGLALDLFSNGYNLARNGGGEGV